MAHAEMKNAPPLYGWAIAVGAGAVATGVSLVVGIEGNGSVAIGAVIALVVGIIFNIAENPPAKPKPLAPAAPTVAASVSAAPEAPVAPAPAAAPATSAAPAEAAPAETEAGTKPAALSGPQGTADDLKQIAGVGPVIEGKLNDVGIYHFWQIGRWSEDEVAWVDSFLNFKGRIGRDDWVTQARDLAKTSPATPPAT